ncbi:MAG: hypothetical protein ABI790_08785 [Betaproteobacteria bacterium]
MRTIKLGLAVLLLAALPCVSGCNSIGFFPQKAAERAADRVLDDTLPGGSVRDDPEKMPEPKNP